MTKSSPRFTLEQIAGLSPKAQQEVRHQLYGSKQASERPNQTNPSPVAAIFSPKSKPRVRQTTKGPNKLEAAFRPWILGRHPEIFGLAFNGMTLTLASGLRYTPDYTGWIGEKLVAWECKGPWATDDSIAKLKVAARIWPKIKFVLAWKENGAWAMQDILS
jgi:hypothetical protein